MVWGRANEVRTPVESRVHDAVDLSTGRVVGGEPSVFGSPTHRLSPQTPYQASPAAFDNYSACFNATFRGVAAGARLLALDVEVWPYAGRTGAIVVFVGEAQAEIPVSAAAACSPRWSWCGRVSTTSSCTR